MGKDKIMAKNLKNEILTGNFDCAVEIARKFAVNDLHNCLIDIAYENYNILSYSFINYFIAIEKQTSDLKKSEYHSLASDILALPLCHITGANQASLFHARKALEYDPNNIENKEALLFYYEIPDKLISQTEAENVAKEILEEKPTSRAAKKIFE